MTDLPDTSGAALAARHVVITRPAAQAVPLQQLLTAAGATPVSFPLIAIEALADYADFDARVAGLARCDWVFFISTNAVQYGMPRILAQLGALPARLRFAAVGPVTAQALQAFGVAQVLVPEDRHDSESLLALPPLQDMAGKRCVIVRGVGGRELLADTLTARGAEVTFAECYRRFNPQRDTDALERQWQEGKLDALVVTSSEAMRSLLAMARRDTAVAPWLRQVVICVNHARIAQPAAAAGLRVAVAEAPGDAAMLQCLTKALGSSK